MNTAPTLLWLRNDLRIADNAALAAAIAAGSPVVPVFIWDPQSFGNWQPGAASKWWLHHALHSLQQVFRELGGGLILRKGSSLQVLQELARETGATRIFWNRRYESPLRELDAQCKRAFFEDGLDVQSFNSALLNEPHTVSSQSGQPYKVYTPYFKTVSARTPPAPVEVDVAALRCIERMPPTLALEELQLMPDIDWHVGFADRWEVSEAGAHHCLQNFLHGPVADYSAARDRPDQVGTSQLSPYLHFGQIGPRQIVHALQTHGDASQQGPHVFLKEIYWREFAYHVLYHFPQTPDQPLQPQYANFPWEYDAELQHRWQMGKTGYPIVDAGMRELWQTGWMHNRVRMIAASLLVKHLLQDWQQGARWFWDTLVDADLASNTLGWQWSGGCGADAAPYFRVFNPIIQGKKFDPEGAYVKRFVPELARLPAKYIHTPWEAPAAVLDAAGITLDVDYPKPVVEHAQGRARALAAFEAFKR